ncbi:hypothetical protein [Agathobaculum sp. Marseille-P7918]|uniref:hypothetical protein n=1 Tax=Agathobaculum sp. Marseille-P7918 TaxID=2479843 RepID=UPI0035645F50
MVSGSVISVGLSVGDHTLFGTMASSVAEETVDALNDKRLHLALAHKSNPSSARPSV